MQDEDDSNNNHEDSAGVAAVDLRRVTSSEAEDNALILEELLRDECEQLNIFSGDDDPPADDCDFVVREGDDMFYLGNLIGKSTHLESLTLYHVPLNDSFRDGLAVNKSIQDLTIYEDVGEKGIHSLAPFLRNTITLESLQVGEISISTGSMKSIANLLSQHQIKSLKKIHLENIELDDGGYDDIARALSMQPQLEKLELMDLNLSEAEENNDSFLGHSTLGDTMKHWKSPCLKVLCLQSCNVVDDDMLALVEGMANCSNLESLNFAGNDAITEVGLRALSSLFQTKKILRSVDLSCMNVSGEGMAVLAPGLASLKSLEELNLSSNNIGDVGLGVFIMGMRERFSIRSLDLSSNAISSGVRFFAAVSMNSLRWLDLGDNNIGDIYEAVEVLVQASESLSRNLECLKMEGITSSALSLLAPVLQSESCCLRCLDLGGTRMEDNGAKALANGLRGNKSLRSVTFDQMSLTVVGWSALERLLCDTSSVNSTYYSNHTLEIIGKSRYRDGYPITIKALLELNKVKARGLNVPICKILMSHSDIDMTPLLQWKLKLLPFFVTWCERAQSSLWPQFLSTFNMKSRKLSAMYQFVVGEPELVVDAYGEKHSITTTSISRKRKINQLD